MSCFPEVLQTSQLQLKSVGMQSHSGLEKQAFKIALNLSLYTLSYHLSLSERGLGLIQPHHNTRLQFSSLFTLLSINLTSSVCFQSVMQAAVLCFIML